MVLEGCGDRLRGHSDHLDSEILSFPGRTSLIAGVKTNVVIAVGVDGRLASDGPRFVPLLNAIDKDFKAPSKSVQTYHSGDLREKSYTTQSRMLNGFPESLTKMPYP